MSGAIVVVGGAGHMGSRAVRALVEQGHDVVVADLRPSDVEGARSEEANAADQASIERVARGSALVMNFAGPYYALGDAVARAAMAVGVPYVDICDDAQATEELLLLHDDATRVGVPLIIGAGYSPGVLNGLALRLAAGFDELDELVLAWVVGERGPGGAAPLRHFFYGITQDIPIWRGGKRQTVPAFSPDSEEEFPFAQPVGPWVIRDVGHPETVTLPRVLSAREIRNKGALMPRRSTEVFDTLREVGLLSDGTITVGGVEVVARDFIADFLTARHNERAGDPSEDVMGLGVRAVGRVAGREVERGISTSAHMTMADATALPTVAAVPQLLDGQVPAGAHGPEALHIDRWFEDLAELMAAAYERIEVWEGDGPRQVIALTDLARAADTAELLQAAR